MSVCIDFTPAPAEQHKIHTISHKPHPLWTTQVEIFPGPIQLQKLNQFKPVLVSDNLMKNLKFPTSHINFTHFHLEFLKDFYIFRISWTLRIAMVPMAPGVIQYSLSPGNGCIN